MTTHVSLNTLSLSLLALAFAACGPQPDAAWAFGSNSPASTSAKAGGGGGGGGRFEIGANDLFFNPAPAAGEVSLSGFVVVTFGSVSSGSFIPPADSIVTANGVALLRDPALNGAYWRVDPAGVQPAADVNGRLTLAATSSSANLSRTLTLTCAPDETIIGAPAEGSSLAGVDAIELSWAPSLTSHVTSFPVPEIASARLWGFDPAASLLGNAISFVYAVGTVGTTLAVGPTDSPAFAAEVRWPGQYLLDGQSGGQCGRVKRLVYSK
jgi:hypothetical protein